MFLTCDFQIQNNDYFEFGNHMLETFIMTILNSFFFFFSKKVLPKKTCIASTTMALTAFKDLILLTMD